MNTKEYYIWICRYHFVMAWVHSLLSKSIISQDEYTKIDTMMMEKYGISSDSIFR